MFNNLAISKIGRLAGQIAPSVADKKQKSSLKYDPSQQYCLSNSKDVINHTIVYAIIYNMAYPFF